MACSALGWERGHGNELQPLFSVPDHAAEVAPSLFAITSRKGVAKGTSRADPNRQVDRRSRNNRICVAHLATQRELTRSRILKSQRFVQAAHQRLITITERGAKQFAAHCATTYTPGYRPTTARSWFTHFSRERGLTHVTPHLEAMDLSVCWSFERSA